MSYNNNLLTGLLGPYYKYEAHTFMHSPCKLKPYKKNWALHFQYRPSNLVSKLIIMDCIQLKKKYSCLQLPWQQVIVAMKYVAILFHPV